MNILPARWLVLCFTKSFRLSALNMLILVTTSQFLCQLIQQYNSCGHSWHSFVSGWATQGCSFTTILGTTSKGSSSEKYRYFICMWRQDSWPKKMPTLSKLNNRIARIFCEHILSICHFSFWINIGAYILLLCWFWEMAMYVFSGPRGGRFGCGVGLG